MLTPASFSWFAVLKIGLPADPPVRPPGLAPVDSLEIFPCFPGCRAPRRLPTPGFVTVVSFIPPVGFSPGHGTVFTQWPCAYGLFSPSRPPPPFSFASTKVRASPRSVHFSSSSLPFFRIFLYGIAVCPFMAFSFLSGTGPRRCLAACFDLAPMSLRLNGVPGFFFCGWLEFSCFVTGFHDLFSFRPTLFSSTGFRSATLRHVSVGFFSLPVLPLGFNRKMCALFFFRGGSFGS